VSVAYTLEEAAHLVGARQVGSGAGFRGVSTDSRRVQPGSLFVALRGERFDGHAYVDAALAGGAVAALVDRDLPGLGPLLVVDDTLVALGALAAAWRSRFRLPVVAITGSAGKTTVKELVATILGRQGAVLATRGNLNNEIGLPLTLFGLDGSQRSAVVELGANHPGEIDRLARIARPDVALVINAGPVHLEGFGSVAGVARAKGELFAVLPENGTALINADDAYAPLWRELASGRTVVTFGLTEGADVTTEAGGVEVEGGLRPRLRFVVRTPLGETPVEVPLAGLHNVVNALAAIAAALAAGADLVTVRAGLAAVATVPGRLQGLRGPNGSLIIDDSYNANPTAFAAAIELLASRPGQRWLAVGDMGELGDEASRWHSWVGEQARGHGIDRLFSVGDLARHAASAFGPEGRAYSDQKQLVEALRSELDDDVTLLVKGSRSAHMERVIDALIAANHGGEG